MIARTAALALAVLSGLVAPAAAVASPQCSMELLSPARIKQLVPAHAEVGRTLARIEGTGRRLLALRSYLRSRESLETRWSWTQAQIDAYRDSAEYRELLVEIENIRARFEAANPGFELYANTEVRSLDQQIQRWNENETVGTIAADLERSMCSRPAATAASLRASLLQWQPEQPSPLAAPGLSLHGRARAIDFQVHQGSRVVAGPETSKIASTWVAQGWSRELTAAVKGASSKFEGPLAMPNEPWHFEYRP